MRRIFLLPLSVMIASAWLVGMAASAALAQDYLKGRMHQSDPMETYERRVQERSGDDEYYGDPSTPHGSAMQEVEKRYEQALGVEGDGHHDDSIFGGASFQEMLAQAQAGNADAIGRVGMAYALGGEGVTRNQEAAAEWLERATQYGKTEYYSYLGDLYRDYDEGSAGFGGVLNRLTSSFSGDVKKDNAVARAWYEKGAAHSDWRSYFELAMMYRDGQGGLAKDPKKAQFYYEKGTALRESQAKQAERELHQKIYKEVMVERGLLPPEETRPQEASTAFAVIQGVRCQVLSEGAAAGRHDLMVELFCRVPTGQEIQGGNKNLVTYHDRQCVIEPMPNQQRVVSGSATRVTHRLYCSPVQEMIEIAGGRCPITASTRKDQQYEAVFDVRCQGRAVKDITEVKYKNYTCRVESMQPSSDRTYVLYCNKERPVAAMIAIGKYDCKIAKGVASSGFTAMYTANCGGLTAQQKLSGTPRRVAYENMSCEVESMPNNDRGYDFELYCK